MHKVVQMIKDYVGTLSAKKSIICAPEAELLGYWLMYEGRRPDPKQMQRIMDWPVLMCLTEVHAFLGTMGFVRIFILNYCLIVQLLIQLTRKGVPFEFGEEQLDAMNRLKQTLAESPALKAIDYVAKQEVVLAVDSSNMGDGYILMQEGEDGVMPRRAVREVDIEP